MPVKNDSPHDFRSILPMLTSVVLFSINTLMVRAISVHAPAADGWIATVFRGLVGLAVVFAIHGYGRGLRLDRLFASRLITLRGVIGGVAIVIFYITIVKLGAARAVILNLTYPVFASVIAALWLKEKISRAAMLWMLLGLCGLVVFLSDDGKILHPSPYDLLAILGAILAGWVVVIIRRLRHEEHHSTIFAAQALYSLLIASPGVMKLPQLPPVAWGGLIMAAIVVAIAQLEMTRAYQVMSVARGSSIQMLLPVFTGIGGFLCFGETFHITEILGAMLTLLATWRIVAGK
jgi:drug/metabolite transporter (DMT)-like permease